MSDTDTVQAEVAAQAKYNYYDRVVRALDMFVNVVFGGELDDTVSGRTARWRNSNGSWWPCLCCKLFNVLFRETDHCTEALMADTARAELEIARDEGSLDKPQPETVGGAITAKAETEGRVVMLHTEALALQASLHAAAQDLVAKAGQVSSTVSQVLSEGRTALSDAEASLVQSFDPKAAETAVAAKIEQLKQFLAGL